MVRKNPYPVTFAPDPPVISPVDAGENGPSLTAQGLPIYGQLLFVINEPEDEWRMR
jgi:hypothetical protein